eukprot:PhF_6_TR37664/c0_g1_i1/m.56048
MEIATEIQLLTQRLHHALHRLDIETADVELQTERTEDDPLEKIKSITADREMDAHFFRMKSEKLVRQVSVLEKENKTLKATIAKLKGGTTSASTTNNKVNPTPTHTPQLQPKTSSSLLTPNAATAANVIVTSTPPPTTQLSTTTTTTPVVSTLEIASSTTATPLPPFVPHTQPPPQQLVVPNTNTAAIPVTTTGGGGGGGGTPTTLSPIVPQPPPSSELDT